MRVFIILYLVSICLQAQMVNSNALIAVDEGTVVGIDANLLNVGTVQNEGLIFLNQNWQNMGIYEANAGRLIFKGSGEQTIMNNGQVINNLEIRNGKKLLNDDLTITGELNLNEGILEVGDEVKLFLGPGINISGAGEGAFIDGLVYQQGVGELFYPIGDVTSYLPITLRDISGDEPEIGLEAIAAAPVQAIGGDLEELAIDAYWQLYRDETYTSGFIELPYNQNLSRTDTLNLVVAQAAREESNFNTLRGSVTGTLDEGFVLSKGNAVGTYFTLAYAPENTPLPPLRVINVVTPIRDGKHDFLRIENIELYPDNQVEIFDRHGNKVFSLKNYNNRDRVFTGTPNRGLYNVLPDGNYFYTIKRGTFNVKSGFIFIKR